MNLSSSLPKRSNKSNLRLLAAIIMLAFLALGIMQMSNFLYAISVDFASVRAASAAAFSQAPQAVPVPTPSPSNWQPVTFQISATPAPTVFQPTAQPVATPPAGK